MKSDTTATQASVLSAPEDLRRALESQYGLHGARIGERLTGGYDLANAVWEFSKLADERDDYDRAAGERFVAAYRDAGGTVPTDEDDLLLPFIRVRRIMEVIRAPADRHVDWEYQRHNVRSFLNLR